MPLRRAGSSPALGTILLRSMPVNLKPPASLPVVAGVRLATTQAIKSKHRDDLTVMHLAPGCNVAAVFTQNRYPAPPVTLCREHLQKQADRQTGIRALVINAGIANAGTLGAGLEDAKESCRLLARLIKCRPAQVLPFSTGVIMERLPMQRYAAGLVRCVDKLTEDNWLAAAKAITTTDTVIKGATATTHGATITGIAKGSGMIHPNMATMLAFVATDAAIEQQQLQRWQKQISTDTYNTISVDGDTSTNDSFVLISTGKAGAARTSGEQRALKTTLTDVCAQLAQAIVRDGEGAKKLVMIHVHGGKSRAVCRRVGESIARSPLVKTALAASDANVGRFLMAIGNAGDGFDPKVVAMTINDTPVLQGGGIHPHYNEKKTAAELKKEELTITVHIGNSNSHALMQTCDLTHDYIRINADYRS